MKVLYVTTIASTMNFFPAHIKMLQEAGHTVELASNFSYGEKCLKEPMQALNCMQHHIPFSRSPFSKDNLAAYKALKQLLAENHYDIVHTHTPNASALVRLACRKLRKNGLRVFYTAHGFHFYSGAPRKNWLVYYPIEKILSHWTDVLITMNQEDYQRARTFRAQSVAFTHGVGVDIARFQLDWTEEQRYEKRHALGIADDDFMILSVGELIRRKNHETAIRAVAALKDPTVKYVICGAGELKEQLEALTKELGVSGQVKLLGIRRDIGELNQAADLFLFPSFQEGLPVALMEAMAAGKAVACSRIRGNVDLVADGQGGLLCPPDDVEGWARNLARLVADPALRRQMGMWNETAVEAFSIQRVLAELREIYGLSHQGKEGMRTNEAKD